MACKVFEEISCVERSVAMDFIQRSMKLIGAALDGRIHHAAGVLSKIGSRAATGHGHFLDRIESLLKTRHGVASVIREMKPTFAKPAPASVIEKIRGADAVIEALAD